MGASCTGSYEVTDVEPGDVQTDGATPDRSTNLVKDSEASVRRRVRPAGVTPSTYILTVRRRPSGTPRLLLLTCQRSSLPSSANPTET
jgi:hypothetical protein